MRDSEKMRTRHQFYQELFKEIFFCHSQQNLKTLHTPFSIKTGGEE